MGGVGEVHALGGNGGGGVLQVNSCFNLFDIIVHPARLGHTQAHYGWVLLEPKMTDCDENNTNLVNTMPDTTQSAPEHPATQAYLAAWRASDARDNVPQISCANATFLCDLLRQNRPAQVLEIGTARGMSAALMAQTLAAWGGMLTTIEISVPTQAIAQAHFTALGLGHIRSLCGDARAVLMSEAYKSSRFGLIFIDAHKKQSHVFYALACARLAAGGVIVVDDAWGQRARMQPLFELLAQSKQAYSLHFIEERGGDFDATLVIRHQ